MGAGSAPGKSFRQIADLVIHLAATTTSSRRVAQGAANDLFAAAVGVAICGIEEVDAAFNGVLISGRLLSSEAFRRASRGPARRRSCSRGRVGKHVRQYHRGDIVYSALRYSSRVSLHASGRGIMPASRGFWLQYRRHQGRVGALECPEDKTIRQATLSTGTARRWAISTSFTQAAGAAHDGVLSSVTSVVLAGQLEDQRGIQRLHKAHIHQGGVEFVRYRAASGSRVPN